MAVTKLGNVTPGIAAELQVSEHRFTAAQMRTLNATVLEVIPDPGDGKFIFLDHVVATKHVGTAFGGIAAGEDLEFRFNNATGHEILDIETTGFLDQATLQIRTGTVSATDYTPVTSTRVIMRAVGAITGGSAVIIQCYYRVFDAP